MKRIISFLMAAAMLFSLVGCKGRDIEESSSANSENNIEYSDYTEVENFSCEINYSEDWEKTRLSEIGVEGLEVCATAESEYNRTAHILTTKVTGIYGGPVNRFFVAMETENKVFIKDIGGGLGSYIYYCDVNGDGKGEAVINHCVDMFGGAGQWKGFVFDADDKGIKQTYNSMDVRFDNGFRGEAIKGFKVRITNEKTGYKEEFDTGFRYVGPYFDKYGNLIIDKEYNSVGIDSFCGFEPKDIDGDGVFEIECVQYTSLYGHSDGIGEAISYLSFSEGSNSFIVKDAYFNWCRGDFVYSDWISSGKGDYTITDDIYTDEGYEDLVKIKYPVLKGTSEAIETANANIELKLELYISRYRGDMEGRTIDIDYEITFRNDRYISILFTGINNVKTAAYPINEMFTINIDLNNGHALTIKDVVLVDEAFAAMAKTKWKEQSPQELDSYIDSVEDDKFSQNINDFYLRGKDIVLIMKTTHAIEAYRTVTIPINELRY